MEQLNLDMEEEPRERVEHVAIMKKSWRLLPKILSGEKTVESRWYSIKAAPWGRIHPGDPIYFKDSGEPVTVRAIVEKVDAFDVAGLAQQLQSVSDQTADHETRLRTLEEHVGQTAADVRWMRRAMEVRGSP